MSDSGIFSSLTLLINESVGSEVCLFFAVSDCSFCRFPYNLLNSWERTYPIGKGLMY